MVRIVIDATAKLRDMRLASVARVNARAGAARARFVTIAAGQEMIYLAKEAEAVRYLDLAAMPPDLDGFPFLAAEIGITAATPSALAALWVAKAFEFRAAGALLERARLGAVATIEAAVSEPVIAAAEIGFEADAAAVEELAP